MKVENKYLIDDFIVLFNYLWYRDFPLHKTHKPAGSPAEWTTHIGICVRSCADLMGYFTLFEQRNRIDAVIQNNAGEDVAHVEWEWSPILHVGSRKINRKVNEIKKLYEQKEGAKFSAFISYRRPEHLTNSLKIIQKQWKENQHPLLVFLVTYGKRKGKNIRDLDKLGTYLIQNGKRKEVRTQPALPWKVRGTRWEQNK